jgi:hypothetical protein
MTFVPTWESLRNHSTPQWFRDAKFGIYTHWGWPGERLTIASLASLYPSEVASVTMLGDDIPLPWAWSQHHGLTVTLPPQRPCDHAYVLKIARAALA